MGAAAERRLLERIRLELADELPGITPGFCLQAYSHGRKAVDIAIGEVYRYYDIASLTKIVFTTPALMNLVEQGVVDLNQPVQELLPWFPGSNVRLRNLLTHTAGAPWWRPYYKSINRKLDLDGRWDQLEKKLMRVKLSNPGQSTYSDLDFFYLGLILRNLYDRPLEAIWKNLAQSNGLKQTHFHPNNKPHYQRKFYAPTECCGWRGKLLRGEVHDDNCWALGGVSTHAGLFSTIDDVSKWGLLLRKAYMSSRGSSLAEQSTVKHFTRRAIPESQGDWGMGFMKPSRGKASCGKYFVPSSFGHTGFTGTSLWMDPQRDLLVVILSNRVFPSRTNNKFAKLRPLLHNWVVESL